MKGIVLVALFAFVAVQMCHAAPVPEDEKKDEVASAPVVDASSATVKEVAAEVKSEPASADATPTPVEATVKVEEKKA